MLENQVVLIAGGTGGIGEETVRILVENKSKVCVLYKSNDEAAQSLKEKYAKNVYIYKVNFSNEEQTLGTLKEIIDHHKKVDVVIHCATQSTKNKRISQMKWEDYQLNIDVQLKGAYLLVRGLMDVISSRLKEEPDTAVITKFIMVLTEYCVGNPPSGLSDYISSKYALMGFSKSMAVELAKKRCTVNMVSPGMVKTKLLDNLPPKLIEMTSDSNPLKRIAEPRDVAESILFLSSTASDYLNGVNLPINGGNKIV